MSDYHQSSKCIIVLENLKCDRFKHSEFSFDKLFNSSFKLKPTNGNFSLQMVGDVILSLYNNTRAASVTVVPLWLIEHSAGSQCGKLRSTCYSHWIYGTCQRMTACGQQHDNRVE